MEITFTSIGVEFVMALVSGTATGLIAGWILMRKQLGLQLSNDDAAKLINLRNSLEEARDEFSSMKSFQEYLVHDGSQDEAGAEEQIANKNSELTYMLFKLPSQVSHLQSERYRELKTYLSLRIKHGDLWIESDPDITIAKFDNLIREINEVLHRPRGIWNHIKHYVTVIKRLPTRLKNRLSSEETELLLQASKRDAVLFLGGNESPRVSTLTGIYGLMDDRQAAKYVDALKSLEKKGLIELQSNHGYYLTSAGWKAAAKERKDEVLY